MVGYDGNRGWIYSLAVRPDLQRKGIGTQMMEHAESWLGSKAVREPSSKLMKPGAT